MDRIQDAINALDGMADGEDDDLGDMCREIIGAIQELRAAAREVLSESETSHEDEDVNLVSSEAIMGLFKVVYPEDDDDDDDKDFGEKIDQLIADGHDDAGVLSFLDEDEHELLVALIRVRREKAQE